MRVNFFRPGIEPPMIAEARIVRYGRTSATANASVLNAENQPLAAGRMVFLTSSQQARSVADVLAGRWGVNHRIDIVVAVASPPSFRQRDRQIEWNGYLAGQT
ncbi:hypothetical protein H8B02_38040 [Bradyrhizobium sp. Pear77]|uniref:hotdog domain-containing protein n=1 Tax=Bradyrhizobium altum TaxID=1571202 RepID=UPI0035D6B8C5|nr:hypothetical protein [Bradyrhizobium altum]